MGHRRPHAPQWFGSTCVFVHTPPQFVVSGGHMPIGETHAPSRQNCPIAHALSHAPQWFGSTAVTVHRPPQFVVPAGHITIGDTQRPI